MSRGCFESLNSREEIPNPLMMPAPAEEIEAGTLMDQKAFSP